MTNAKQTEKEAVRIADAIVELVERTDGPVTLPRLDREIPGFAQKEGGASWQYVREHDAGETVFWEGMTEAGCHALRRVISGRRVAIQSVTHEMYRVAEDQLPVDENWSPIILHPKVDANVDHECFLMRLPPSIVDAFFAKAAVEGRRGYSLLKPPRFRCYTRDQYAA
jgi:hypothetical protein